MSKVNLLVNFVGRSVNWGFIIGGALAVLYYLIAFQFVISVYLLYVLLLGLMIGILLGGFNGLILGLLTLIFFQSDITDQKYRVAISMITLVTIFTAGAFILYSSFSLFTVVPNNNNSLVSVLVAIVAAVVAAYASQNLASWYLKQYNGS